MQPDLGELTGPPLPVAEAGGALAHLMPTGGVGIQVIQPLQAQEPDIIAGAVIGLHSDGCCVRDAHYSEVEDLRDAQHRQAGYFVCHAPLYLAGCGIPVGADQGL